MSATATIIEKPQFENVTIKLPKKMYDRLMLNFKANSDNNKRNTGQPFFKSGWFGEQFEKGHEAKQKLRFYEAGGTPEMYNPSQRIEVEPDEVVEEKKKEEKVETIEATEAVEDKPSNMPYFLLFTGLLVLLIIFLYLKYQNK